MAERNWRPAASFENVRVRARMLSRIRAFFAKREVLEVETPGLAHSATLDPHMNSFALETAGGPRFLTTSPEHAMKRLLAADYGDIYQVSRVFRQAEYGRFHNPEFTLLEWYRTNWDHWRLMNEVDELINEALDGWVRLADSERFSFYKAFRKQASIDPFKGTVGEFEARARQVGIYASPGLDRDGWLDLLMSHVVAPAFPKDRLSYVYDYPASQAALARIRQGNPSVAERFEVFLGNLELANGFHELTDHREQCERFKKENRRRLDLGLPVLPADQRLINALAHGLPDCAGVALGLDRLLMIATGASHINEVLTFPWDRA
jgi:lysyl-tRNA synthetase class 2